MLQLPLPFSHSFPCPHFLYFSLPNLPNLPNPEPHFLKFSGPQECSPTPHIVETIWKPVWKFLPRGFPALISGGFQVPVSVSSVKELTSLIHFRSKIINFNINTINLGK